MLSSTVRNALALLVGVESFKTPQEVWQGLARMTIKTGLVSYPHAFRKDRVPQIVRDWIGENPEKLSLAKCLSEWSSDKGATRATFAIGCVRQYSFNRWRSYSLQDIRTMSTSDHADRGGASAAQGQDRLLADHGHAYVRPDNSTEFAESMDKVTRRIAASRGGKQMVQIWKLRLARVPNNEIAQIMQVSPERVSQIWEGKIRPIVREEFPELVNARK